MMVPQRLLIVNPFGIGDVLFSTPLVRALRRAFPGSFIGYLCNRRTEEILRHNPHLNELFVYEKDEVVRLWRTSPRRCVRHVRELLRQIRRANFDLVVDLSLGERYGLLMKLLGVPRRMGFHYRHRGRFLTERFTIEGYHNEHVVHYYRRLLHFMGIELAEDVLELRVLDEDDRWARRWLQDHGLKEEQWLVGIVPAGGVSWGIDAPFRRWHFEGFAAVGDALVERYGARVLLFGEAVDEPVCRRVKELMRHPAMNLGGQTTLGQFVSLLSRLSLVICNDGGPLHLAVSQGVRTVSIFGPVDPQVYGPYPPDDTKHQVVHYDGLPCRPCYHQFKLPPCPYERACLAGVAPAQVLEACDHLLGRRAGLSRQRAGAERHEARTEPT